MLDTVQRKKFQELQNDQWVDSIVLIENESLNETAWEHANKRYLRAESPTPTPVAGATGGEGCEQDGHTPCASCDC